MTEKPHTVAIGAFVVGALLIALGAVVFAVGTGIGSDKRSVVMVFDGSVKGLSVGAPVALRGVQIGQVTNIELVLQSETTELIMLVEAELSGKNVRRSGNARGDLMEELIARGMRAQLNLQSLLTGLLYVQLDFHPESPLTLADIDSPHLQIPTIPTELQRLTRQIESVDIAGIAINLEAIVNSLNEVMGSEEARNLPARLEQAAASVTGLSDQLREQLSALGPRMEKLLDSATVTAEKAGTELPRLSSLAGGSAARLEDAMIAFEQAMLEIDDLVSPDSATTYQLNRALEELARAGRALQLLARTLEEQPEALIRGKSGDP
ncbi:MAG: MlaD family protein [Halioglobus sp.]|jgi:paraquat-inducible protein B